MFFLKYLPRSTIVWTIHLMIPGLLRAIVEWLLIVQAPVKCGILIPCPRPVVLFIAPLELVFLLVGWLRGMVLPVAGLDRVLSQRRRSPSDHGRGLATKHDLGIAQAFFLHQREQPGGVGWRQPHTAV
jgi:hypothetical protein